MRRNCLRNLSLRLRRPGRSTYSVANLHAIASSTFAPADGNRYIRCWHRAPAPTWLPALPCPSPLTSFEISRRRPTLGSGSCRCGSMWTKRLEFRGSTPVDRPARQQRCEVPPTIGRAPPARDLKTSAAGRRKDQYDPADGKRFDSPNMVTHFGDYSLAPLARWCPCVVNDVQNSSFRAPLARRPDRCRC